LSLREVRRLRSATGAEVVHDHAAQTRQRLFNPRGIPVVIAARNEAEDLPATLLTLSRSQQAVQVWVAVNGTTDQTAARATAMGARVLECPIPSKTAAVQMAVAAIHRRAAGGPILFTDADTLVGPGWAGTLAGVCRAEHAPVIALGNALFTHGDSAVADMVRNARKVALSHRAERRGRPAIAQGANMAIDFAGSARALDCYMSIDPTRFIGEEQEIVARVLAVGGVCRNAISREATVITRGDRFRFLDLWRLRKDDDFSLRRARYQEYGEISPYAGDATDPIAVPVAAGTPYRSVAQSRLA